MFITGYEDQSVEVRDFGKMAAVVHLVTASAPAVMPLDGADVDGLLPTHRGKDTAFLPGSDCLITGTGEVKVLNDNYVWDTL